MLYLKHSLAGSLPLQAYNLFSVLNCFISSNGFKNSLDKLLEFNVVYLYNFVKLSDVFSL